MSGTGRNYEALNRTHREVEGQRENGPHHNYGALRETQRQVDARPTPAQTPQQQELRDPYKDWEERKAAFDRDLEAKVASGAIRQGDVAELQARYDNRTASEMKAYDQRLERARDLKEAANAHNAKEQQKEAQLGRAGERDDRNR
jgi:monoamine oxidase